MPAGIGPTDSSTNLSTPGPGPITARISSSEDLCTIVAAALQQAVRADRAPAASPTELASAWSGRAASVSIWRTTGLCAEGERGPCRGGSHSWISW